MMDPLHGRTRRVDHLKAVRVQRKPRIFRYSVRADNDRFAGRDLVDGGNLTHAELCKMIDQVSVVCDRPKCDRPLPCRDRLLYKIHRAVYAVAKAGGLCHKKPHRSSPI